MSNQNLNEEVSRRDMLRTIAIAMTATGAGTLGLEAGRHVHNLAKTEKETVGTYSLKFFNQHEYRTVRRLAELIIPADEKSGSAVDAGAGEFIDLLCSQNEDLGAIYTGGLLWLDQFSIERVTHRFVESKTEEQISALDLLSEEAHGLVSTRKESSPGFEFEDRPEYEGFQEYTIEPTNSLGPGVQFFTWVRRMSADAFYTSPIGIRDVGYQGNAYRNRYRVPQEAIDHVMSRRPWIDEDN
jgi:hypothetical protein